MGLREWGPRGVSVMLYTYRYTDTDMNIDTDIDVDKIYTGIDGYRQI